MSAWFIFPWRRRDTVLLSLLLLFFAPIRALACIGLLPLLRYSTIHKREKQPYFARAGGYLKMNQCRTCYIHQRKRYDDPNGSCEFLRNTLFATKGAHPHEAETDECMSWPPILFPVLVVDRGEGRRLSSSLPPIHLLVSFE